MSLLAMSRVAVYAALWGAAFAPLSQASAAGIDHQEAVKAYFQDNLAEWVKSPEIIEAVRAQNGATAAWTQAEIDAADAEWRAEAGQIQRPQIDAMIQNSVSQFLRQKQSAADWMIVEIIVMDGRGLNVGVSTPTSDYWQGDEAKFQKTFLQPEAGLFIDDIEYEPDTHLVLSQANSAIIDPDTGEPIGALTVSLNLNKL
ncbi:hypothetical protein [Georhizobium sp. MAB10]|uniref:hypothetical protein n=1 Tax=Georhizobium sp. MAB10 TaxID=3028319 RepID=UPI003855ABB9